MESEYKEILLLKGLDNITDEELHRFKYFLTDELPISTGKLENANRTEVANLMIQNAGAVSAVIKTIHIFQKLNYRHEAKNLQEEKEKVDKKYKTKKETKLVEKKRQPEMSPGPSTATRNDVVEQRVVPEVSPHIKKQTVVQQETTREEGLQKDRLTVTVLKAMKPFEFETQEGKQEMFHATVATESEFFFVKVFNTRLKDKFIPKRIIIISKYYWHVGFLEVNNASLVFDAKSDQKMIIPTHITRKAGETPKINKLQTQPLGTIVNGVYVVQKKTEGKNRILFEMTDNTDRMEVLVRGRCVNVKCEEGDKLRLTFFELSKSGEKLQLKSGVHSFIKVIKAKK
ncbi:interferon-inducible protein AIM2 [Choloepus didactylus]|uniref:interferon-inducible protein AIM2 n=1 Tax=Choloepus didactylus TaxID=27675 RepID=UPI00189DF543|nr:interferon-inducible protein AIM2 [Choloepus didactylus]XP_037681550.1 interferon-inducible protein AIM2 [Choloepus didactylus]XP_037681551.1 interferon-inducible protein AIM2 [Choloepus didactylus]XP_037681552.1 interferon-inducible protein AIM2 [Choloepus didactylus]XP_037681553.1 interferon-inducible protein AIM2 [Choloepus didactylus]XP_037681554.1 interferon-inducible protein AIM2 [Choloepus didactylus]XP_037681555.1 interferon-inducible protein AIM2 [Choloepus didactylus]